MEQAAEWADIPDRAVLVGRLLGHELAWEHEGIGVRATGEELVALAWFHWQAEGRMLAGPDADRSAYLAGLVDAYASR